MSPDSPESPSRTNLIVTLVHGTFARKATWVGAEGSIAKALKARFGEAVSFESLRWSGSNSFRGRREATGLLREHILAPRSGRGGAAHVVIAHSHAGNVVAYAARDPAVDERLAGVVTLATPFIVARERNLGQVGTVVGQALVIWLVLGIYWFSLPWLAERFGAAPEGRLSTAYKIAFIVALALLIELPGLKLASAWRRSSGVLLGEMALAPMARDRLLILRALGDEATSAITFLQFPSVLATLVFGRLAGASDSVVGWCARLARRPIAAIGACVLFLIVSMAPGALVLWLTGSELSMWVTMIGFMCLSYGPVVFLLLGNPRLAYVTAAGCLALPLAPVLILVGIAAAIAYGPRFALANLDLEISVEGTPIGEYALTLLSPAAAADPERPGGLLHSALYDDDRAIDLIGDFIAAHLRSTAI